MEEISKINKQINSSSGAGSSSGSSSGPSSAPVDSEERALQAARRSTNLFGTPSLVEGATFFSGTLDDDDGPAAPE